MVASVRGDPAGETILNLERSNNCLPSAHHTECSSLRGSALSPGLESQA